MLPTIRKTTIFQKYTTTIADKLKVVKINFEDNEELRNIRLWGINVYSRYTKEYFNITKDPNYNLFCFPETTIKESFLNLVDINGNNFVKNMPLLNFQTLADYGIIEYARYPNNFVFERDNKFFTGQKLDLQNSFVSIYQPANVNPNGYVLPLEIYYTRIDLDENNLDKLIK